MTMIPQAEQLSKRQQVNTLTLPGKLTLTSLQLQEGLSFDTWQSIVEQLSVMERSVQWWLGDALNYGERVYGEKYTQALDSTHYEYQSLANFKWVASKVEFSLRKENLSFGHHNIVAAMPASEQTYWLNRFVELKEANENYSIARLRQEIEGQGGSAHVSHNSGENEWYTPSEFIEAARKAMGSIDCDPASSVLANETVKAATFYAAAEDGLKQQWRGNVWMNPPYAQPLIAQFSETLIENIRSGATAQACVLVNNATETAWFQTLLQAASAVCFVKGRVRFLDTEGKPGAPLQGQMVLYIGDCPARFVTNFLCFGIARAW